MVAGIKIQANKMNLVIKLCLSLGSVTFRPKKKKTDVENITNTNRGGTAGRQNKAKQINAPIPTTFFKGFECS